MRPLFYFFTIAALLCFSCKKNNVNAGKNVEIFLFKNYQVLAGKCQIDPAKSTLQEDPIIKNQDILQYSKSAYQFELTDISMQKVKGFTDNMPFAVTVDKEVIYYGFFKPGYSSSSCGNSITMDIIWNKVSVNLGYPTQLPGVVIDDQRNNPNLIAALKNQGKLN